jgi:hypothetical protein
VKILECLRKAGGFCIVHYLGNVESLRLVAGG